MVNKIEQDHQRFRQIIRGKIRKDLRRFLSRGELIGKEGRRFVSIPVHDIDIPNIRYGDNAGGVGMGEGGEGDFLGAGEPVVDGALADIPALGGKPFAAAGGGL